MLATSSASATTSSASRADDGDVTVRTHYLDWIRLSGQEPTREHNLVVLDGAKMPWLPFDTGDTWVEQCHDYWMIGMYAAGPEETGWWPEDAEDVFLCNHLWAKYNADDRPDGQERRSMSLGDVIQIDQHIYLVREHGFERTNWEAP